MSKRTDQEFLSDIRYFGINLDIVWHIVTIELPEVASQLETTKDEGK